MFSFFSPFFSPSSLLGHLSHEGCPRKIHTQLECALPRSIARGSSGKIVSLIAQQDTREDMQGKDARVRLRSKMRNTTYTAERTTARAEQEAREHLQSKKRESTCRARSARARAGKVARSQLNERACAANCASKLENVERLARDPLRGSAW